MNQHDQPFAQFVFEVDGDYHSLPRHLVELMASNMRAVKWNAECLRTASRLFDHLAEPENGPFLVDAGDRAAMFDAIDLYADPRLYIPEAEPLLRALDE